MEEPVLERNGHLTTTVTIGATYPTSQATKRRKLRQPGIERKQFVLPSVGFR
jgi:hypothetical protein